MHGVRDSVLERQIASLGLPALKVMLPQPCSNEVYEQRMAAACERLEAQGVRHIVFGDLFLEDIRAYREKQLAAAGMAGVFSFWARENRPPPRAEVAGGGRGAPQVRGL